MAQSEQTKKLNIKDFDGRILRNRQYKRPFENKRPTKRLFTPEIKKYLKSWLIRRRENPYPSREEKMELASETGLTYIQICNWFANWRRKLKNSGKNVKKYTWSTLIKSYNDQAYGNVEHLSISSNDSIWEEPEANSNSTLESSHQNYSADHCYTSFHRIDQQFCNSKKSMLPDSHRKNQPLKSESLPQCFQISSTTDFVIRPHKPSKKRGKSNFYKKLSNKGIYYKYQGNPKKTTPDKNRNYKKIIDEFKSSSSHPIGSNSYKIQGDSFLLSKWRKRIVLFHSGCKPYSNSPTNKKTRNFQCHQENSHAREELDAAEALTFLSRANLSVNNV